MDCPSPYYFDDENVLRHYQTDITVDTEAVLKGDLGPEVLDFIFGEVQGRMVRDLGMVRRAIPSADDPAHCDIFCTEGWLEAERLLVFVTNKRRGQAGIWSRGLCISSGLNVGSMLPYIAKAKEASFGVVVLNANANSVQLPLEGGELAAFVAAQEKEEAERAAAAKAEATAAAAAQVAEKLSTIDIEEESGGPGGAAAAPAQPAAAVPENPKHANLKTRHVLDTGGLVLLERPRPPATKKHPIATSSTPEEHMATVWETVLKPAAARSISFLCFDEGAALVANLLQTNPAETFLPPSQAAEGGGGGAPVGRVSSVVLIEPFHSRSAPRSPELETFLGTRSLCIEREASAGYEGGVPASWVYALHNTGPGALQFTYEGNGGGGGEREQASNLAITIGDTMDSAMAFLVRSCVDHTPALGNEFLLKTALKHKATAVPFIAPSASGDGGGGAGAGADEPAIVKHRSFRKMVSDGFKKLSRKGSSSTAGGGSAGEAAAPPPAPVVEQLSLDNFELLQVVGKGAFGKVFLVQRKSQGKGKHAAEGTDRRIFAMKVLLKSHIYQKKQVEHTKTERTILQTVDHPFLVRLRYAFQTSKKLYMLMDYYAGGSLFYHLMKQKRFSFEQANFYAAELFLAMHHLHTLSIAYRDVKLENILMDKDGHVHLTDFGLSKQNVSAATHGAETFCGTAEYVAPELLHHSSYGKAADWWSFGILVYEMIVGRTPFYSKNRTQMFQAVMNSEPRFPEGFPAEAADIVRCFLTKDPATRLGSADDDGWAEVRGHSYFAEMDWEAVERKEAVPPYRPNIKSATDVTYVHKVFLKEAPVDSTPNGGDDFREDEAGYEQDRHFEGFDFFGDQS